MIIGIDVGGTHTDGVLLHNGKVLATSKVPTLDPLEKSILNALDDLLSDHTPQSIQSIERIVFSTTLTTNLIAEGKYPPTGLVLIPGPGLSPEHLAYGTKNWFLSGSIDHRGRKVADLDKSEIAQMLSELRTSGIRDVAVVSKFSSRNPALEEEVKALVMAELPEIDNIQPGYRVAPGLNFPRRVQTSLLNTAVQRKYAAFLSGVRTAIAERGITAKLFLLKADGGTMPLEDGLKYGVETVKSGPAASIMGFLALIGAEERTALLLDIGGTTTDIAFLANGVPLFEPAGVQVDRFSTSVKGLLSRSLPYGGDSAVVVEAGSLKLLPRRPGPAIAFGGSAPTLTDALAVTGELQGEYTAKAIQEFPTLPGYSEPDSQLLAAQEVVRQFSAKVAEAYQGLLAEINGRPVYTIHELLQETRIEPEVLLAVGGPAPALVKGLAEYLSLEGILPTYHHVANALGAAVARPTMAHTLYADTVQKFYTISGVPGKQPISGRFSINDARQILLKHTRHQVLEISSDYVEPDMVQITHEESFNVVRGFSTQGQIIKLEAQLKPGIDTSTGQWYLKSKGGVAQ